MVEAAVDDFWVECYSTHPVISPYGELAIGQQGVLGLSWEAGAQAAVYAAVQTLPGINLPGGTWYLGWPWFDLGLVTIPADGTAAIAFPVLNEPALIGVTLYFQALAAMKGGGPVMISNLASGVVQ